VDEFGIRGVGPSDFIARHLILYITTTMSYAELILILLTAHTPYFLPEPRSIGSNSSADFGILCSNCIGLRLVIHY